MGQLTPPVSVSDFKAQFSRDFIYGPGLDAVRDSDIQSALNIASSVFNPCLFDTTPVGVIPNLTSEAIICYCNAAAHFLVTSLQAVGGLGKFGKGVFSQGEGNVTNKNVGGVSVALSYPSSITDSPVLFQFAKTTYGQAYLQVLSVKLVGNVGAVFGETAGLPNVPFF